MREAPHEVNKEREEPRYNNRLIIGLGGIGSTIVNNIISQIKLYGDIPENVEFMIVDTDPVNLAKCDQVSEKHKIQILPHENQVKLMNPWLDPRLIPPRGANGCGNRRIFGSAVYNTYGSQIIDAANAICREMSQKTGKEGFAVILISALGGGTGSSFIVRSAIDIRNMIEDNFHVKPFMIGLGILPLKREGNIYLANAYGALKELHFLMQQKEEKVVAGMNYLNPFHMFLLAGREIRGQDGSFEVIEGIKHFLIDLGFIPSKREKGEGKWLDFADIHERTLGNEDKFSTLGYYEYRFPKEKLLAYFKIKEEIPRMYQKLAEMKGELGLIQGEIREKKEEAEMLNKRIGDLNNKIFEYETGGGILSSFIKISKEKVNEWKITLENARRDLEKAKEILNDLLSKIERKEENIRNIEKKIRETEAKKETLHDELNNPPLFDHLHQVNLKDEEIKFLEERKEMLGEWNFKRVMEELNREDEYLSFSHEQLTNVEFVYKPLVNYIHTRGRDINPKVMQILTDKESYGLVRKDPDGNPTYADDRVEYIIGVLSTAPENIIPAQYHQEQIKKSLEIYAKDAPIPYHVPPAKTWRYNFAFYTLMIGLKIWPPAQGLKPRLKELGWIKDIYEQRNHEEVAENCCLFYGKWEAFTALTGIPYKLGNDRRNVRLVTEYWKDYRIITDEALWDQVPLMVATAKVPVDEITRSFDIIINEIESFEIAQSGKAIDSVIRKLKSINDSLSEKNRILNYMQWIIEINMEFDNTMRILRRKEPLLEKNKIEGVRLIIDEIRFDINTTIVNQKKKIEEMLGDEIPKKLNEVQLLYDELPDTEKSWTIQKKLQEMGRLSKEFNAIKIDFLRDIERIENPLETLNEKLMEMNKLLGSHKEGEPEETSRITGGRDIYTWREE